MPASGSKHFPLAYETLMFMPCYLTIYLVPTIPVRAVVAPFLSGNPFVTEDLFPLNSHYSTLADLPNSFVNHTWSLCKVVLLGSPVIEPPDIRPP